MAPDINAEHSFFSIAMHVHPEVVFKGCARGGGIGSIQRALELVYVVPGTVSVSNQHVISIHAQNDELFIGLEGMGRTFAEQNLLFPRESQRSWPCTFSFAYQ